MADSKSQKKNDNKPVVKKPNKIQKWWRETIGELRKVTWPTKEEALKMTKIVIVVVLATALFLGVVDFIFSRLVGLLLG
ncbi:MAG: preprotein translocase subunit SecE [Erysipelotrichales bacterium]|nr:preprotein translocase subunit SecE [Erysipelotrichales bacterium]